MGKFGWAVRACGVILLWAGGAVALPAQTFTTLHSFDGSDGGNPFAGLAQGADGNLHGTTSGDFGVFGNGTIFKITPSGVLTTVHTFDYTDGQSPVAPLIQATNGNFFGTVEYGGAGGTGTVFEITPAGALTTLHSFNGTDGATPIAGLVQGTDGKFYGTTFHGGTDGYGTVFSITAGGTLMTLHSFDGADGESPYGGLVQGTDGKFYGTTYSGGANGDGTVFSITARGALTTLHSFDYTDGEFPYAGLVQGTDGNFYGTTSMGGANFNGTVFEINRSGQLQTLYSFCSESGCADGTQPGAALVQGTDGKFYGTTSYGGTNDDGTIFSITAEGALATLHSFDATDGAYPYAALIQDTNGSFYGTTSSGGASGDGAVFSLSVNLGPFVETNPSSGNVGAAVRILGTNLTGATKVTFHGAPAIFTVVSSSEITTTVPAGATNGLVKVVTPKGTLSSNVPFTVN